MDLRNPETSITDNPADELERHFMGEYLGNQGYTWGSVRSLPEADFNRIMTAAAAYACSRLEGVQNKAALLQMIRTG